MRGKNHTAALALAWALLAGVAHAQPRDVAKADALFREGRVLLKKGDYEAACPKLEESYRLDPAAGTGVSLGDCFEKSGKVASALLAYQAARALLRPGDPRIGPVEKEIAALDKRAPRLTIKLAAGAPEGTTVKRDGREVETSKLGVPVVVNPGKFKVVVTAPGRDTAVFRVSLVEGKNRELEVGPGQEIPGQPPTAQAPPTRSRSNLGKPRVESSPPTEGYVLAGIGVVGLGVGIISAVLAENKEDAAKSGCKPKCDPDGWRAVQDGQKFQTVSYIGWGVGILGLASASYFLFLAGPSDGAGTAVGAAATPGAGSVVLKGRF